MSLALYVTQSADACNEHELVAAVRRGDDRAFEELYSRYRRRIGAYVLGMVADHGRAEDITQEVFIAALRRMRESERPIAFKPWIYEIAKNACIDDFRRARRAREVPIGSDDEFERENLRLLSTAITPDAAVENRQQLTDLRGAFRGLSESHHKIIVLRELEGLSYTQIGERMGMSRPVVESTLFRARRRLGEEYNELVSGRRCEHVQGVIGDRGSRAVRSLGIKERRLVARHLAHCQPCRRHAHLTGFDESALGSAGVVGKIAALLPIPAWLRLRRGGASSAGNAVASRSHPFSALQSAQTVATYVDPTSTFAGMGRVAAAAATLVIAGAGGGIVTAVATNSGPTRPARTAATGAGAASRSQRARAGAALGGVALGPVAARVASVAAAAGATAGSAGGVALSSANSTSGAGIRVGAGAPRSPGTVPAATRVSGRIGVNATPTASSASASTAGSPTQSQSGLPKLPTPTLPSVTLPSVNLPSVSLPSLPTGALQLPSLPLPSATSTATSILNGAVQGVKNVVKDPTSAVAPVLKKLGLP